MLADRLAWLCFDVIHTDKSNGIISDTLVKLP